MIRKLDFRAKKEKKLFKVGASNILVLTLVQNVEHNTAHHIGLQHSTT